MNLQIFKNIFLILCITFSISVNAQITDNFTDNNINSNPTWYGDTSSFMVVNPPTTGDGSINASANADTHVLSSKQNVGDAIIKIESSQAYGEWRFNVADGKNWSISSTNDYKIILMSDDSVRANLKDGSQNFNGYFLQQDGGVSDHFVLYKQTGTTSQILIDANYPISADGNTPVGRTIKITRSASGDWNLYIAEGFDANPSTLYGTYNDNTFTTSTYFGIATNIANPGTVRVLYFDNLYIGSIIYDTIPPTANNVNLISANQLDVSFSESLNQVSAEDVNNYSVNNGIGTPNTATLDVNDNTLVHLNFANNFTNETSYELTLGNIGDLDSNLMIIDTLSFTYFIVEPNFVVINEIMADPSPVVQLPEYEYIELYNTKPYDINLVNWKLKVGSSIVSIPNFNLSANSYLILTSTSGEANYYVYGNVLGVTSFPALTNSGQTISILDSSQMLINTVSYTDDWYRDNQKNDGGWSIEKIDPENNCTGMMNWRASVDFKGGTPGFVNSVFAQNIDTIAPILKSISITSQNSIKLNFNEFLDTASTKILSNYTVNNGIGNPDSIVSNINDSIIELFFNTSFTQSVNYTITVQNIIDNCGNVLVSQQKDFMFYKAKNYDIVINEIMADPTPVIGLPNDEYIEIYNRSDYEIDVDSWYLKINSTLHEIPNFKIQSHQYVVFCDDNIKDSLISQFGAKVVSFSSFPSLTNSGATLSILDKNMQIISTVSYSDTWYQSSYKAEGGWSLEQIDYDNPCGGANNWTASNDNKGGTPGKINSVYAINPDENSPEIARAFISDSVTVKLVFTESIDSTSMYNLSSYFVDNSIGNPISIEAVSPNFSSCYLTFSQTFVKGVIYTISVIDSLSDCSGNLIDNSSEAKFAIPDSVCKGDVIINEVLYNPLGSGVDFVEIYNKTEKVFNLKDMRIATINTDSGTVDKVSEISNDGYLFFPKTYLVLTTSSDIVKKQYYTSNPDGFIDLASMPTYSNNSGIVVLTDYMQNKIDEFTYNDDMQYALLNSTDGVSLERLNFNQPTNDKSNWHSAAETVGYATPGYKNSQYTEENPEDDDIVVSPEIFSPDNDGFNDVVTFTYNFKKPSYVANATIYDSKGRTIRKLYTNEYISNNGVLVWDGITDSKEKARVGIYILYFQIFDLDGNLKKYKRTCVLATKFN